MNKVIVPLDNNELIKLYNELKSSYKVAILLNTSATAVKRVLKELGVLRTQNVAASERKLKGKRKPYSNETKKKFSEAAKKSYENGRIAPFKGKTLSEETRKKLSEKAKNRLGERNPNYKNGKYFRRPRDFKHGEFKKIRSFIFNRDKFKCLICLDKKDHLHAHHLIPFWIKPEAFCDTDNIITVCTNCHFEKAHLNDWACFDVSLIPDSLITKYELNRERLNELGTFNKKFKQ